MSTYTHKQISTIWWKATPIKNLDKKDFQKDKFGNKIRWKDRGKISEYGWEIDHIIPKSKGGTDDISNLQPLHWQANRKKSDKLGAAKTLLG